MIPWLWSRAVGAHYDVGCTVCGQGARLPPDAARAFLDAHGRHVAAPGYRGLGDAVAAIAKPLARALGLAEQCTPCEARRVHLNRLAPRLWRR